MVALLSSCWSFSSNLPSRLPIEIPDNNHRNNGRQPSGDVEIESVREHNDAQNKQRVHGAILEVAVFLDSLDVLYGEVAHQKSAQAIAQDNQRHYECEGE